MVVDVVGIQNLSFSDQKTGQQVVGSKLYFCYEVNNVLGYACDSKFFSSVSPFYRDVVSVSLGDSVDLSYSPKGQLIGFRLCPPKKTDDTGAI